MMGTHHAICGAAAWVAITNASTHLPSLHWHPLDASGVALGALVCAGAALLPDADHPSATIAHSVPGVGAAVTSVVGEVSGGHRHGTHSGLSAVGVAGIALWAQSTGWFGGAWGTPSNIAATVLAAALLAFSFKVLKLVRGWGIAWLLGVALSLLISWAAPGQWVWLPLAIAVGWIVHLAGDFLTTGGLPLLWPWNPPAPMWMQRTPVLERLWSKGGYFALPILGNTGSYREWLLMVPLGIYALAGIGLSVLLMIPWLGLS